MKSSALSILAVVVFSALARFAAAQGMPAALRGVTVRVVEDQTEWPPFVYRERKEGKETGKITGFSVELFERAMKPLGIPFTVDLLPWKRALAEVADGRRRHAILNATLNPERMEQFLLSDVTFRTHEYCFYSRRNFPSGLVLGSKEELRNYRVVGLRGWNFSHFGLGPGDVHEVDSVASILELLKYGRYDLNPTSYEGMMGHIRIDPDLARAFADAVAFTPIPGMEPVEWRMLFPRNAVGEALRELVNRALAQMRADGSLRELGRKHGFSLE